MRYLVKNKNTIMFAFAILLCAIIASCEDAKYDTIGSRIYLAESSSLSYESKKVTVAEEGSVVTVTPRSGQIATEDIEVTLGLSPKSLEVYNTKSGTNYKSMPEGSYSFDQKLFDGISIETDVTENDYYGLVNFMIEGYPLRYHDYAYVDTVYTAKEVTEYLDTLIAFIISSRESDADCIALYMDEEYKVPFVEKEIENDDDLNIYVRFEMPENLTSEVCVFDNGERSWVYLVYIDEAGSVFKAGTMYSEYKIKTINGEKWKEGDSTDIVCEGGKTYIIVFDTPNLMG